MNELFYGLSLKLYSFLYFLVAFLVAFIMAYFISEDAEKRGMSGKGWFILIFLFSVISMVLYFIIRKPKLKFNNLAQELTPILNLLKDNGYIVEYQDDFKVQGIIMKYKSIEYEILYNDNQISAKLIPPLTIRLLISFILSLSFLFLTITYLNGAFLAVGFILIFITGTYLVDLFYNLIYKKTSIQINLELGKLHNSI